MGGFALEPSPPPPPTTSKANDDDEDDGDDNDATASKDDGDDDAIASKDDGDASSSGIDEMSTWHSYPLSLVRKNESSFGYESSHS